MTRPIKFRAYSKSLGGYIVEPIFVGEGKVFVLRGSVLEEVPDAEIIQFTGLLDKNGKEIYEGDVLILKRVFKPVVWNEITARFVWKSKYPGGRDMHAKTSIKMEIIGNIYENPELLK